MHTESHFSEILTFLKCRTPLEAVKTVQENIQLLLLDHAHAEKKAALTAISLISKYPEQTSLVESLSRLAREELSHFDKVLRYLKKYKFLFRNITPGRYARTLHNLISSVEPQRLIDNLIIAAIIEARSCERFLTLTPFLQNDLKRFYESLALAESRHFEVYLNFINNMGFSNINSHLEKFLEVEKQLILSPDNEFRFHGGIPHLDRN